MNSNKLKKKRSPSNQCTSPETLPTEFAIIKILVRSTWVEASTIIYINTNTLLASWFCFRYLGWCSGYPKLRCVALNLVTSGFVSDGIFSLLGLIHHEDLTA